MKNLSIGNRISILVTLLVLFLLGISSYSINRMAKVGETLTEIVDRDIPLNGLLRKITVHQLEQAILLEEALRIKSGKQDSATKHKFDEAVSHFKELAHLVDDEITEGKRMVQSSIEAGLSEKAEKEFKHVGEALKLIEEHHYEYENHAFEVINRLNASDSEKVNSGDISVLIDEVLEEQTALDKEIEALFDEVASFTEDAIRYSLNLEETAKVNTIIAAIVVISLAIALSILLSLSITRPIANLTGSMEEMTKGNLDITIPTSGFNDETKVMAEAMEVFRSNEKAARRHQSELNQLVGIFGESIQTVFNRITERSSNMLTNAANLMRSSSETNTMANETSVDASETAESAQSLSTATEEMTATAKEISRQINKTKEITDHAVLKAQASERQVCELQEYANEIGNVVSLITSIADKTNLLALNATIEAASAGEAGKGFAVVANEVKDLARQTNQATNEVSDRIARIQAASKVSAESIAEITEAIDDVDQFTQTIASAVEEQTATTGEMARSISQFSQNSQNISSRVAGILDQSGHVDTNASDVNNIAAQMSQETEIISKEVYTFLNAMKKSDVQDTTHRVRTVDLKASITTGGNWSGTVKKISGAFAELSPKLNIELGDDIKVSIDNLEDGISARVSKHENESTTIQFPLNDEHLAKMNGLISQL